MLWNVLHKEAAKHVAKKVLCLLLCPYINSYETMLAMLSLVIGKELKTFQESHGSGQNEIDYYPLV